MCFAGSIRDVILMKNFDLLSIIGALFAVMLIFNLATGNFHLSFSGQPIAHSQHLWNILGMYAVGFAAVLGWRMPAASDHSGRAGLLGQCGNLSGNAVRGGTCTQF